MIYTDENTELRAIISDLNQQAIGYVDRIAELEAVLKATVPKLNRMMRMPNTEWVADEHNAAVEKLKALLGGGDE